MFLVVRRGPPARLGAPRVRAAHLGGRPASCTFDAGLTMAVGKMVKVCGWYDNEMGYSTRLVDLVKIVGTRRTKKARAGRRR